MATSVSPLVRCDQAPAWPRLQAYWARTGHALDLRAVFAGDPRRFESLSQQAPHVFADLSKNLIDAETEALLRALARDTGLETRRDAMFAGAPVNSTEQRAVLHTLLRAPPVTGVASGVPEGGVDLVRASREVHATLEAMLAFAAQVRDDTAITDVVNIGIGGSDLGPKMVVRALQALTSPARRLHFVSNVDGHELASVLAGLDPQRTLFLVASKTFTTAETMLNAHSARRWFEAGGGTDVARHFVGLTSQRDAAHEFGIRTTFGFRDWVGGRYSLWSAIGLPIAIAVGTEGFRALLAGAHAMDEHFRSAPLETNLPVRLGLLDVWYRNFHGFTSRNIAPYHAGLRYLAMHLQQVEMESNGKRVDLLGHALGFSTSPVVWGEPGCNGQHAFFQMLHQGPDVIPVEFIAVRQPAHDLPGHHDKLLANALAQARALMNGQSDPGGHRHCPGNRPSTFLVLDRLSPEALGALIALQEHRVFVSGTIWGINSFDQWGVELGKVLARDIEPRLASGDTNGLDASTAGLLQRLRGEN